MSVRLPIKVCDGCIALIDVPRRGAIPKWCDNCRKKRVAEIAARYNRLNRLFDPDKTRVLANAAWRKQYQKLRSNPETADEMRDYHRVYKHLHPQQLKREGIISKTELEHDI